MLYPERLPLKIEAMESGDEHSQLGWEEDDDNEEHFFSVEETDEECAFSE